jgi:ABC-type bacteriocin/lantibiotic exporter with double-glycine peptidase domain
MACPRADAHVGLIKEEGKAKGRFPNEEEATPVILLEKLHKRFGSLQAISDLNLEVSPGELFGFLGPNGAGKTTTIRLLTGLLRPTSGRVLIGGYDVQVQPVKAKALLGYVPDEASLYEKLNGTGVSPVHGRPIPGERTGPPGKDGPAAGHFRPDRPGR